MIEEHIRIDENRFITVPKALRRIAVQNDHNIETVTFDCPRHWDGHDMSTMRVFINYMCADGSIGMYLAQNITIDGKDENIMHFDWTISRNATKVVGALSFLVCVKKTDEFGYSVNHWNSELNREMYISEGLECEESILEAYPDVISYLLTRQDYIEGQSSAYVKEHIDAYFEENPLGVDKTLSVSGLAADSAVTGAKFDELTATINANDEAAHEYINAVSDRLDAREDAIREDLTNAAEQHNTSGTAHWDIRQTINALRAFDVGAYSKDETVDDVTRALFDLGDDDTPKDVFNMLGRHYWKRRRAATTYSPIVGDIVEQTDDNFNFCVLSVKRQGSSNTHTDTDQNIYYSDRVTINEIGQVRLVSPSTLTASYSSANVDTLAETLRGKYVHVVEMSSYGESFTDHYNLEIAYIPEDATFVKDGHTEDGTYDIYPTKRQLIYVEMVDREWENLSSDNETAYPKNVIQDGYEYVYLGRLLDNLMSGKSKVAAGYYKGDGTCGYDGVNTLSFDFVPKVVSIPGEDVVMMLETGMVTGGGGYLTCGSYGASAMWYRKSGTNTNTNTNNYATRVADQLNTKDKVYHYIAFG